MEKVGEGTGPAPRELRPAPPWPVRPCSLSLGLVSLTVCAACPQVMKRVRTEQIQMAVSCYLKRRQYVDSDGPLKPGLRLSQTPEEMAASLAGKHGAPGQPG